MPMPSAHARTRDLIVIGCSAGGVEALPRLLAQLPAELEAAIAVVQHLGSAERPYLVEILCRSSGLPVGWAEQGQPLEYGRVFVAPPDVHMLFSEQALRLSRGPRENHSRPSIDKLFRSAAAVHDSRVIAILLTGMLYDGVAGLRAIQDSGGMAIVQDPEEAAFPELPRNALRALAPDQVLKLDEIGPVLCSLIGTPAPARKVPIAVALEAELDRQGATDPTTLDELGPQSSIACPDCHGPMWRLGGEQQRRFRCALGHVAGARELVDDSESQVETALWGALQALNDRAHTLKVLGDDADEVGPGEEASAYLEHAREARRQADRMRQFMLELSRAWPR